MSDKNNLTPDGMLMADSGHSEPLFKDAPAGELMSSEDSVLLDRTKQSTPAQELLEGNRQQTVPVLSEQEKALQEFTEISTQTETLLKSYIDRPVAALSWIEDRKQADRISAFALRMLMCQENVERRINAAKERLDTPGAKQADLEKAKNDYIESLRKGIAVCRINTSTMGHIEKALEKHAFLPVVVRACSFPLTQKTSRIDDNGEASLEEAQARLIAFRSMITFDYHKERGFVNGGSWLEDLEAFKLADRNAVEEGHLTQEQADKRYSWTHGYRFELPPESMIPKEGERNGVYKEQYDRMDFSILHTRMTCEQIEIAKGNPDPAVQEFAKQLEEVFFSFHHVYFKVSASGEDLFNRRGASQEDKDQVMAKMAALSFRIGTLANDIRSALAAFATNAPALSDEKKQESLKAFKALSQVFYKEIPSDTALRREYEFNSAVRKGNSLINTAAGLVQYAKGLTTADEDFEREFSAYYDARARRHEQNDSRIKEGVNVKYMDDTKGDQIRIEQRREQLETEEGRRLEEERRLEQLQAAAELQSISTLRTNAMGLSVHIPKNTIEKLDDYKFEGHKYTGVGKAGAFFVRHGFISGGKLKNAMAAHIDRFLRSDSVSDAAASTASSAISEASGLFSEDMTAHWSGFDLVADKLNAVKTLSTAKSKEDILAAINTVKTAVGGAFSPTEPGPDSEYFSKYPYSAKIILMHKLLSQTPDTASLCEKGTRKQKKLAGEFTTRLDAVKHSMQKLYDAVTASGKYQEAIRAQREETTEAAPSPQSVAMYDTKMS